VLKYSPELDRYLQKSWSAKFRTKFTKKCKFRWGLTPALPLHTWTTVRLSQTKEEGTWYFTIEIGGKEFAKVKNKRPRDYRNLKLFNTLPKHIPARVMLDNVRFNTRGKKKFFFQKILNIRLRCLRYNLNNGDDAGF